MLWEIQPVSRRWKKKYKGIDAIMDDGWLPLSVGSGLGDGGPGSGGVLFIIFEK